MKKIMVILCALVIVVQPAIFNAVRAEVATETDVDLPCEQCGGKAIFSWQNDGDGNHVLACPHGVKNEEVKHRANNMLTSINQEKHAWVCSICGLHERMENHVASCTNVEQCCYCGQTSVNIAAVEHSVDYSAYEYDDEYHWYTCLDCGKRVFETKHSVFCTNPETCHMCEQEVENVSAIVHAWSEQYNYNQDEHWMICQACNEEYRSAHYASCMNPDVCIECGQTGVAMLFVIHENSGEMGCDEVQHWYICPNCGEKDNIGDHYAYCLTPDVCAECGHKGVTMAAILHDVSWRYEFDNDRHWIICPDCGERVYDREHDALCVASEACRFCGQSGIEIKVIHRVGDDGYQNDSEKHWYNCRLCNELITEEHEISVDNETTCTKCGADIVTSVPTAAPTATPTAEPTAAPTATPTAEPTAAPTATPTAEPTATPTATPTAAPTTEPTVEPTAEPTAAPEEEPTAEPSVEPTEAPTATPIPLPTMSPAPVESPTAQPTVVPTKAPVPVVTEEPAHEHTFDVAFVSNGDGTHSKACLSGCGEVITEPCQLVTTDMGLMTCTACVKCGYAVYAAKAGVSALNEGETVPAVVVRVESAVIASADETVPEAVPVDTVLVVHETTFDVPVTLPAQVQGTVEKVFTAALVKDGENIQPSGRVKLSIPVDEDTLAALEGKVLMLLREDGTMLEVAFEVIDGQLVFLTDELGIFLLMEPIEEA